MYYSLNLKKKSIISQFYPFAFDFTLLMLSCFLNFKNFYDIPFFIFHLINPISAVWFWVSLSAITDVMSLLSTRKIIISCISIQLCHDTLKSRNSSIGLKYFFEFLVFKIGVDLLAKVSHSQFRQIIRRNISFFGTGDPNFIIIYLRWNSFWCTGNIGSEYSHWRLYFNNIRKISLF